MGLLWFLTRLITPYYSHGRRVVKYDPPLTQEPVIGFKKLFTADKQIGFAQAETVINKYTYT